MHNYILDDKMKKRFLLIAKMLSDTATEGELSKEAYLSILTLLNRFYSLPVPLAENSWNTVKENMIEALEIETQVVTTVIRNNNTSIHNES